MIRYIPVKNSSKSNWLDDQGVLVGFDDEQQCCEDYGYGVYEKESGKRVDYDPSGLHYHFAKDYEECCDRAYCHNDDAELFQVEMYPDEGYDGPVLVFECYNDHNGYYYHDFEMKVDFSESCPCKAKGTEE